MVILIVTVYGTSTIHEILDVKINRSVLDIQTDDYDYALYSYGYSAEYEALKEEIANSPDVVSTAEWGDGMFTGQVPSDTYSAEYWEALREIFSLYYHRDITEEEFRKEHLQDKSVVNILAVDDKSLQEIAERAGISAERLMDAERPAALMVKEGVISTDTYRVSEMEPKRYRIFHIENMSDLEPGDEVALELYDSDREENVTVPIENAGIVSEEMLTDYVTFGNDNQYVWLLVSTGVAKEIDGIAGGRKESAGISPTLYMKMDEKDGELIDKLERLNDIEDSDYIFAKLGSQENLMNTLVQIADVLLGCFVVLTSVICLLNLFNSIRGWRDESRQEWAVLYSVGMTKGQLRKMLLYECLGIFLRAVLWAGICSGLLYMLIQAGVTKIFGNLRLPFPIAGAAFSVVLAGGVLAVFTLLVHGWKSGIDSMQN